MNQKKLFEQIKKKRSFLSIGLDVDLKKIPPHLLSESDPIFSFCKKIIDSTNKYAIAYKPNIAFFESYGAMGWKSLEKVSDYLSSKYPEIFSIAENVVVPLRYVSSKMLRLGDYMVHICDA